MKRAWTAAVLAVLILLSFAGCAPKADTPNESATVDSAAETPAATITVTPAPATTPAPNPLAGVSGIETADVRQINMYDDSQPPETPVAVYSTSDDIIALMEWLTTLQTNGEALTAPESEAPGDWKTYDIVLFDGSETSIHFAGDTLSAGGAQFRYTGPDAPELTKTLWLDVDGSSFSSDTEIINFSLHNDTGSEVVLLFEPLLERAAENGWEPLERTEEFCGMPDPVTDTLIEYELPLEWFPNAGPGVYRLSLEAYDEDDNPFMISDIFEIG